MLAWVPPLLGLWLLTGADAVQDTNALPPPPAATAAASTVEAPARDPNEVAHPMALAVPHYRADLGLDVGADTFLFKHGQTAFELELSPRLSYLINAFVDVGFYAGAGYGGPIPLWTQLTMFGIGPFVSFTLPVARHVNLNPWLGVMYHYAFIEGFTGARSVDQVLAFPQQSVRIDIHGDVSFLVTPLTAINVGAFLKTRLAPITEGPGTAAQLAYGLRLSALSSF